MAYPACLLTLKKCLFYSDLPQTTINDLRKRLNACVTADGSHFEHPTYYVNCVVTLNASDISHITS